MASSWCDVGVCGQSRASRTQRVACSRRYDGAGYMSLVARDIDCCFNAFLCQVLCFGLRDLEKVSQPFETSQASHLRKLIRHVGDIFRQLAVVDLHDIPPLRVAITSWRPIA